MTGWAFAGTSVVPGTELRCLGDSPVRMSSGQETKTCELLINTQQTPGLYYHLLHVVDM
jgi:hypothetical protein